MIEKLIIWTPELSDDYGAFSQCQNIEQPKPVCDLCEENEAFVSVVFKENGRDITEVSCIECYSKPDYQIIISHKKGIPRQL